MNSAVGEKGNENEVRSNGFSLTAEMLSAYPEYDGGKVLKKAKWKVGHMVATLEGLPIGQEDLEQEYLTKVWQKRGDYDPSVGSRSAYAGGIIEGCAKNDYRDIIKRAEIEGTSLDAPIEGGKADSIEKTHADVYPETSELMPMNFRGARRILLETDLRLARSLMTKADWTIFWLLQVFSGNSCRLNRV